MMRYLAETWDLHAEAAFAFGSLAMILVLCGVLPLWAVSVAVVLGPLVSVGLCLWIMVMVGGPE